MKHRILVIGDNPANMESMVSLLNAYGHQSMTAGDGLGGLAIARRERTFHINAQEQRWRPY